MTAGPHGAQPGIVITAIDGRRAEVTLTGDADSRLLHDLEARLADARLQQAEHWVLDLHGVTRIELACAYALLRAVTQHSGTAVVRAGRRAVLRTLRHAGLDKAAVIED
ncbi:STAS domain-containing protein [Streptomyces collinus]|uniref:STAS domain-containing protein n=1 Tax=Streptomyces collinus TaxID=42684 RepID=UPI0037CE0976